MYFFKFLSKYWPIFIILLGIIGTLFGFPKFLSKVQINLMKYVWDFIVFSALQKLHSNVNSPGIQKFD